MHELMHDQDLTTVVMLIPPHEVQALAVPILRKYAPDTLTRVPAHLTVLYPFVAFEQLDAACAVLRTICAHTAPFDVTMSGYDSFPGVAFMTPLDPSPIESLFQRIFAQFPECPPYDGAFGNDLHPHMTVGEFHSEAKQRGALLPYYAPITFHAARLHIMYGIEGRPLPWITHDVIPLGS